MTGMKSIFNPAVHTGYVLVFLCIVFVLPFSACNKEPVGGGGNGGGTSNLPERIILDTSYGTDVTFTTTGPQGCIATTLYPSNTVVGPASNGSSVGITPASGNCNYAGEYASVSLTLGTYTLTSSTATDYLTVTTTTGTILASGVQPLSFSIATAGTYWMHVFKDNLCTSEGVCRGLTITKNSSTVAPAVTTTAATAITAGGATCGGNVTSAG